MPLFHIEEMCKMAGNMIEHSTDPNTAKWATMHVFGYIHCWNVANAQKIFTGGKQPLTLKNFGESVLGIK